jgi:hypothetical protein
MRNIIKGIIERLKGFHVSFLFSITSIRDALTRFKTQWFCANQMIKKGIYYPLDSILLEMRWEIVFKCQKIMIKKPCFISPSEWYPCSSKYPSGYSAATGTVPSQVKEFLVIHHPSNYVAR